MVRYCKLAVGILLIMGPVLERMGAESPDPKSPAGECMTCHKEKSPGLYRQWFSSSHARHGVTCIDCHAASQEDPDAYQHFDAWISTLVTPKDCSACHEREFREVAGSHHARAGQILKSADAYLAHVTAGHPAAIQGCESCHGAPLKIDPDAPNKLSPLTWPNSGIGRINPDGSEGSCNACHPRHTFAIAQARQPESCSKCHLGPDHPQKEVYEESKHGNTYYTHLAKMNLDSFKWVVGEDYFAAPTCATCHMSATATQTVSHDVGNRLTWNLRPPLSTRQKDWQTKGSRMKDVCSACHGSTFVTGHYHQYDASVRLYNEKFAKPATELMTLIRSKNLLKSPAEFGNTVEWVYWELWHHEGRRARHGASMMGPDYTWWHGFYDIAQHFYFKLIPEARKLNDPDVNTWIDTLLKDDPMHRWLNQPAADLKAAIQSGELQTIYSDLFKAE
ncbi:hypothetical protein JXA80_04060 [bacterium]|nr:hypothetical protein [candidate division CSSED10-310 bacterium]